MTYNNYTILFYLYTIFMQIAYSDGDGRSDGTIDIIMLLFLSTAAIKLTASIQIIFGITIN